MSLTLANCFQGLLAKAPNEDAKDVEQQVTSLHEGASRNLLTNEDALHFSHAGEPCKQPSVRAFMPYERNNLRLRQKAICKPSWAKA